MRETFDKEICAGCFGFYTCQLHHKAPFWSCHDPYYYERRKREKLAKIKKGVYRQVYICKTCGYITLGYFAKARIARHGQLKHGWAYYQEDRFTDNARLKIKREVNSEKDLTEKERKQIKEILGVES